MLSTRMRMLILTFFFQAEDGIRDRNVTGVQTCALPILIGAAAPNTATRPLGTNCSDQKMIAQLHPMLIKPTIIATAIVRLPRGKDWRKATATMVSAAATATALANAKTNGGTSLTPIFIAAQVEPQISATLTYPARTRSGGMREG